MGRRQQSTDCCQALTKTRKHGGLGLLRIFQGRGKALCYVGRSPRFHFVCQQDRDHRETWTVGLKVKCNVDFSLLPTTISPGPTKIATALHELRICSSLGRQRANAHQARDTSDPRTAPGVHLGFSARFLRPRYDPLSYISERGRSWTLSEPLGTLPFPSGMINRK